MKPYYLNHITSNFALPLIAKDKIIQLEGYSIMQNKVVTVDGVKNIDPNNVADLKKHLAYQYATIGRYVWLTQDVQCLSVYHDKPEMQSCMVIDTDYIKGLEKWSDVRQRLLPNNKAREIIKGLEYIAVDCGDNPELWWVTKYPISIKNKDVKVFTNLTKPYKIV
tara:strand:- start:54 stop:548 length:495 start_codon:yes stop_codon:yes gene_type:complete